MSNYVALRAVFHGHKWFTSAVVLMIGVSVLFIAAVAGTWSRDWWAAASVVQSMALVTGCFGAALAAGLVNAQAGPLQPPVEPSRRSPLLIVGLHFWLVLVPVIFVHLVGAAVVIGVTAARTRVVIFDWLVIPSGVSVAVAHAGLGFAVGSLLFSLGPTYRRLAPLAAAVLSFVWMGWVPIFFEDDWRSLLGGLWASPQPMGYRVSPALLVGQGLVFLGSAAAFIGVSVLRDVRVRRSGPLLLLAGLLVAGSGLVQIRSEADTRLMLMDPASFQCSGSGPTVCTWRGSVDSADSLAETSRQLFGLLPASAPLPDLVAQEGIPSSALPRSIGTEVPRFVSVPDDRYTSAVLSLELAGLLTNCQDQGILDRQDRMARYLLLEMEAGEQSDDLAPEVVEIAKLSRAEREFIILDLLRDSRSCSDW